MQRENAKQYKILRAFSLPQVQIFAAQNRMSSALFGYLTQALAALPEQETAPEETTQEMTESEDEGWIEITLPVAIGICLAPNLVLVIVLLIRKIRRKIASKLND